MMIWKRLNELEKEIKQIKCSHLWRIIYLHSQEGIEAECLLCKMKKHFPGNSFSKDEYNAIKILYKKINE